MFDRYDEKARRAVFFGRMEAGRLGAQELTSTHLLLGVRKADPDLIAELLTETEWQSVIKTLVPETEPGPDSEVSRSKEMLLAEDGKRVLLQASEEVMRRGHGGVSTAHLLFGILKASGPVSGALSSVGISEEKLLERLEPAEPASAGMKTCPVTLLGVGGVGLALLDQILELRMHHAARYHVFFSLRALGDSSGLLTKAGGALTDAELTRVLEHKRAGHPLAGLSESAEWIVQPFRPQPGSLLVDCTASSEITPVLLEARRFGCPLVLANKKPLTGPQADFVGLVGESHPNRQARWEATVGAGLPVIATVCRMAAAGDEISLMQGTLSGTLGYLMSGLDAGRRFSELVREAHQKGYTEPDPREDLAGEDVARKALILARTAGWEMERGQIHVESLVPPEMGGLSLESFWDKLPELDGPLASRVREAAKQNSRLRYAVRVEKQGCQVGLLEVPEKSPLGSLEGTNQLVEIHSRWYTPDPLVIQGRGAGVQATASGVLADMVQLALGQ